MKFIKKHPIISIALIILAGAILLELLALTWSDPLQMNKVFQIYILISIGLTGVLVFVLRAFFSKSILWVGVWFVTGLMAIVMIVIVRLVIGGFTISEEYARSAPYNYPHFNYATYMPVQAPSGQIAGSKVKDFVLEELDGNRVRLSDLYSERPVLIEFGSFT